jgi:hypothetical protein
LTTKPFRAPISTTHRTPLKGFIYRALLWRNVPVLVLLLRPTRACSYQAGASPKLAQLNQAAVEQLVQQEQSRQAQMIFLSKLTEIAFEKCVVKPDTTLSSREVRHEFFFQRDDHGAGPYTISRCVAFSVRQSDCVAAVMHKYVDAQKLVVGRYTRQQAAQQPLN